MIHDKKEFSLGLGLLVAFFIAFFVILSPIFPGEKGAKQNGLDYLDGVFNSISKDAAYYIPDVIKKAQSYNGNTIAVKVKASNAAQATRMEKLFTSAGATVAVEGDKLAIGGDLGKIASAALSDADLMFKNDGAAVKSKYGIDEKQVLFDWHTALGAMMKDLQKQEKFKEAKILRDAQTKALEPGYNYYGVQAIPMKNMMGVALIALAGYVIYTVWYGYAILFLFEGWGLKLEH